MRKNQKRSRTGRVCAPFADHREQNCSREEGESDLVPSHRFHYDMWSLGLRCQEPLTTGGTEVHKVEHSASKSHDVIPAIDVDHLAGDAAAGVGREEDSG